ncbi:MAG: ABC transporter permease subunit [Lentisphaeria bacterium]
MNPKLKQGFTRFRRQKRAFYSLLILLVLFVITLPAELLCNSKPIMVRLEGKWYFPVFQNYTEHDFGGRLKITADYRDLGFWRRIGCDPAAAGLDIPEQGRRSAPGDNIEQKEKEEAEEILDMFGSNETENHPPPKATPESPAAKPQPVMAGIGTKALFRQPFARKSIKPVSSAHQSDSILELFDPEPHDQNKIETAVSKDDPRQRKTQECRVLWPPVRYDYAYIETNTKVGRSALVAPWPHRTPGSDKLIPSGWLDGHYLGTDNRGRDVLARLVYGLRVSLLFGLLLAVSSTFIGATLGAVQGFFAGWVDLFGQRLTEIWGSLPRLYLLMILSSLLARNIIVLFVILNITSWMGMAAYMRAEFLKGRNLDYVKAARALGVRNTGIMFRHILPNSMTPIITFFPFAVTGGILALVSLDFLNLGVPSPFPSIGEMLRQGQANLHATWIIIPAFIVLSGTITMLTFIGDGLRNAFDPRKAS